MFTSALLTQRERSVGRFVSLSHALLLLSVALVYGCDSSPAVVDAGPEPDAGFEDSYLFGPCVVDAQCPGDGAVCRTGVDGWPQGFCTVPCSDRTPCDSLGLYHHCVEDEEGQGWCERNCVNGIDCGRELYTCVGEIRPGGGMCIGLCSADADCGDGAVCNRDAGRCVASAEVPTSGSANGGTCQSDADCRGGECIQEMNSSGTAPTGWNQGYCVGACILPFGYNSNTFFNQDTLPQEGCADGSICYPSSSYARGDPGRCYAGCTSASDCRTGYSCFGSRTLNSGERREFTNGICVPGDCGTLGCPSTYSCVTVSTRSGDRNYCMPPSS